MKIIEPIHPQRSEFFTSVWKKQTWLNVAYLFISFPLGLIYFIFLITGLSLGLGLLITVFGIFILMGVLWMVHAFNQLEVELANSLLGFHIQRHRFQHQQQGFWKKFKELLRRSSTWKGLIFQLLRFPLGTLSFSLVVSLLSASISLISTPFIYRTNWFDMSIPAHPRWEIDTFPEALGAMVIGIFLFYASLYLFNWLAWLYGKIVRFYL